MAPPELLFGGVARRGHARRLLLQLLEPAYGIPITVILGHDFLEKVDGRGTVAHLFAGHGQRVVDVEVRVGEWLLGERLLQFFHRHAGQVTLHEAVRELDESFLVISVARLNLL